MRDTELAALLSLAGDAAWRAGEELARRLGHSHEVTAKSSLTDPVSEADRASEALLTEALLSARPDDALLGEEGTTRQGTSGVRWVLDPLDGTVNYLYGFPAWCVSVACEDETGTLVGAVADPVRGELFAAARGQGATCGGRRLAVNDPVALDRALVATGFSYDAEQRASQGELVAGVLPRVRDVRRSGSAALDLCWLAAGRVDGYYEAGVAQWDWAAGGLIAAEAGAVVEEPSIVGRPGVLAAGPGLADSLRGLVAG